MSIVYREMNLTDRESSSTLSEPWLTFLLDDTNWHSVLAQG